MELSFWERQPIQKVDAAVVGAGIVGLSAAIAIKAGRPQAKVVVIERGIIARGASWRNAGFGCFGSPSELLSDLSEYGADETHRLVERRFLGLQKLLKLADVSTDKKHPIGYEIFDAAHPQPPLSSIALLNDLLRDVFDGEAIVPSLKSIAELGLNSASIANVLALPFERPLMMDQLMGRLLQKATAMGILVLNGLEVRSMHHDEACIDLVMGNGEAISASQVAVATNAYGKELIPELEIFPGRGQVLVTKPIDRQPLCGQFHFDEGFYYFRGLGSRILIGGGRNLDFSGEGTAEFGVNQIIREDLESKLRCWLCPGVEFEVDYGWSGIMAFGPQRKPIVARINPRVCFGGRSGGMGVALGAQIGEELAGLIIEGL